MTQGQVSAKRRAYERRSFHWRVRAVFRAWPVRWTEEVLPKPYPYLSRDFVVGDTQTGFIVRVLYPDETDHVPRPGAILAHSLTEVIQVCQRHLR